MFERCDTRCQCVVCSGFSKFSLFDFQGLFVPHNTNVSSSLRQSYLIQELTKLEDSLTHLVAAQRFCTLAVRAITCPTFQQQTESCDWHLGWFVTEQWLEEQGQQTIQEIQQIRTRIKRSV